MRKVVSTRQAPNPIGPYSQAVTYVWALFFS